MTVATLRVESVNASQTDILKAIIKLYNNNNPFHADVTYGNGNFYKDLIKPKIRIDIVNKPGINVIADTRILPLRSLSLDSVVFDPPFIHAPGKDSIIGNRFGGYPSQRALRTMYKEALSSIDRCLKYSGLLVVKCQDIIESGRQNMNHVSFFNWLNSMHYECLDLFILTGISKIIGWNHSNQQHSSKTHTYTWVFRKGKI